MVDLLQGKGEMVTYWLIGKKKSEEGGSFHLSDSESVDEVDAPREELPGEITQFTDPHLRSALSLPLPGRHAAVTMTYSQQHGNTPNETSGKTEDKPEKEKTGLRALISEKLDKVARVLPNTFQLTEENGEKEEDK